MPTLGTSPLRLTLGQVEMVQESTFGTAPGSGFKYCQILDQPDLSGVHRHHMPNEALRETVAPRWDHIMAPDGVVDVAATFVTSHHLAGYLTTVPTVAGDMTAASNSSTGLPLLWILRLL
ncbi:hypothetical protein HN937_08765, partial [Candidatus Poribacteria bacterium]|nr:hypothetical protein [Candidatus Poribacteria bacterium]